MATVKPAVMKYIYGSCSGPADLRKDASRLQRPNAQPNVIKKNRLLIESNRVHSLSQILSVFMIRLNIMALILVYGCKVKQSSFQIRVWIRRRFQQFVVHGEINLAYLLNKRSGVALFAKLSGYSVNHSHHLSPTCPEG